MENLAKDYLRIEIERLKDLSIRLKEYATEKETEEKIFLISVSGDIEKSAYNLETEVYSKYSKIGSSTSNAKKQAARENGKKRGRPRKIKPETIS